MKGEGSGAGQLYIAPETARLFEQAESIAENSGDSFVTAERLLLALAMASGTPAARVLADSAAGLYTDPTVIERARVEFEERRGEDFEYRALLGDREPPLDYRL